MIRTQLLAAALVAASLSCQAGPKSRANPSMLASVAETHNKEIGQTLDAAKEEAIRYREAVIASWWGVHAGQVERRAGRILRRVLPARQRRRNRARSTR